MDILVEQPYIKKVIAVIKNSLVRTPRKISVKGRLSDAFVYILSGECEYTFENGARFTVRKGDLLYLANNAVYDMKLQTDIYQSIYVNFLFDTSHFYESKVYPYNEIYNFFHLFKKLYQEYQNINAHSSVACMHQLYEIYLSLCKLSEKTYVPSTLREKIEESKNYMQLHYADSDLSLPTLSQMAKMSEVYYRKNFYSVYKISPKKYLTQLRINKACELLQSSFLSIEEVASSCGFSSWPYFSKVFKLATGETPAVYRKNKKRSL